MHLFSISSHLFIPLIQFLSNKRFICNKIVSIVNESDFAALINFNLSIFYNYYNSGDI